MEKIKAKNFKAFFNFILLYLFYYFENIYLDKYNKEEKSININQVFNINRQLTKYIDNITIVSGYFKLKSKHSFSDYDGWISNFLQINCSMVFFVDSLYYQQIISKRPKEYKNKTIWIKTNLKDFYSYKNYLIEFNHTYNKDLDKKINSIPLYLIRAEKVNFLKIAILKNFFKSKCFYWVDAGCFRNNKSFNNYINDWPSEEKCFEDGRVLFNEIQKYSHFFKDKLKLFDFESHNIFQINSNVDGSIFGGQKEYILKFHSLYYKTLNNFLNNGIFIGKDQNIYAFIAYFNKKIVRLVYLKKFFGLQEYLKK